MKELEMEEVEGDMSFFTFPSVESKNRVMV